MNEVLGAKHQELLGTWTQLEWDLRNLNRESQTTAEQIEEEQRKLSETLGANTNTGP